MSWQPIETAPKDGTVVSVWHRTWKCPVSARYISGNANATFRWVEATLTTQWPDEAFSHWQPLPAPPVEQAKTEVEG
jgi:hypothetical protein